MKNFNKLLWILAINLFFVGNVNADKNNPTNQWLKDKNVTSLIKKHGYVMVEAVGVGQSGIVYVLRYKDNYVSCATSHTGDKARNLYCYLP